MSFSKLLNALCTIQEKSDSQTATGSITSSWANKNVDVPCRRNSDRSGSVNEALGKNTVVGSKFYMSIDTDINEGDRIIFEGKTYDVILVAKDSSGDHLEIQTSYKFSD